MEIIAALKSRSGKTITSLCTVMNAVEPEGTGIITAVVLRTVKVALLRIHMVQNLVTLSLAPIADGDAHLLEAVAAAAATMTTGSTL